MTPRPLTDAERAEGRALLAEYRRRAKDKSDDSTAPGVHFAWDRAQVWLDGYLRNHAEALLDAADELARLKAGVADRDHTTHFDDCGCRSARYEAEVARLKAKLAAVREHAATFDNAGGESAFMSIVDCLYNEPLHYHHDGCPECTEHAPSTTFRDDAATTPEGHEEQQGS